jgi:hypothetical protein
MPNPQFEAYVPSKNDTLEGRVKGLTNSYFEVVGNLNWLLQHLDESNVVRAKAVVADWVYAGKVSANQITAGTISATISIVSPIISGGDIRGAKFRGSGAATAYVIIGDAGGSGNYGDLKLYRGDSVYPIFDIYDQGGSNGVSFLAGSGASGPVTFLAANAAGAVAFGSWSFVGNVSGLDSSGWASRAWVDANYVHK